MPGSVEPGLVRFVRRVPRRQRGASLFASLSMLVVIAGAVVLAARLGPFWIEHRTLVSILEQLPVSTVRDVPRGAVYASVDKQFALNGYGELKSRDLLDYQPGRDATVLVLAYERRAHLLLNLDLVIVFNDRFEYR